MATPRQKIQVGIFLSVCGLLLVIVLLLLGGMQREKTTPYFIAFDEDVSGLGEGAEVRYRGVPVGRVTEIAVTPENRVLVRLAIRPSALQVRPGMVAQLGTAGITGLRYVNLTGGEAEAPPLAPEATIPSTPSFLTNLTTELPAVLASINAILLRLDQTLGQEGQVAQIAQSVENLVQGLESTLGALSERLLPLVEHVDTLVTHDVRQTLDAVTETAQSTRQVLTHTDTALQEALASSTRTFQRLERSVAALDAPALSAALKRTLQGFTKLEQQVGNNSQELTRTLQSLRGTATDVEFQLRQAVRAWRETLAAAKEVLDYLERNPSAVLFGRRAPSGAREGRDR